ncbi:MAG: hypothetical protein ACTHK7_04960 [Aureliella sp.]
MVSFAVIEVDDGLTIVEVLPGQTPEEAAASQRGTLVDPGPYRSYEDANDALVALQTEDEEEERA